MPIARLRLVARVGSRRSPYSWFVVGSATVHIALAIALIVVPSLRKRPPTYDNPLIVELAAPAAKKPASRASPPAPTPVTPAKKPEGMRVETKEPEPTKKPPEPDPEPQEALPPDPGPTEIEVEEDPGPLSGEGTGGAEEGGLIAPLEGGDLEFAWYRSSVTAQLFSHWRRPLLSGFREPIEVAIAFEILRDGRVGNVRIEQSSGVPSLDRSALRAVSDAAPLPPLPATWEEPSLPAGFVFRLFPDD